MRLFRFLLVLCIPAILLNASLNACGPAHFEDEQDFSSVWDLLSYNNLSFTNIMAFVGTLESEEALDVEGWGIDESMRFVAFLARNGIPDWDTQAKEELEQDIEWLFSDESNGGSWWHFSNLDQENHSIIPAIASQKSEIILCSGWFSNKAKKTKNFIKKHKKAIIVAAVVVTAVVIIVVTKGAGTPAAAGMVGALESLDDSESRPRINKPGDVRFEEERETDNSILEPSKSAALPPQPEPSFIPPKATPKIISEAEQEAIHEQISMMKETLSEQVPSEALNITPEEEPGFWDRVKENARESGAELAHGLHQFVSGSRKGHEWIDTVFGTDQANSYPMIEDENQPKMWVSLLVFFIRCMLKVQVVASNRDQRSLS